MSEVQAELAEWRRKRHAEFVTKKAKNNPLSPRFVQTLENRESRGLFLLFRIFKYILLFSIIHVDPDDITTDDNTLGFDIKHSLDI